MLPELSNKRQFSNFCFTALYNKKGNDRFRKRVLFCEK